MHFTKSTLLLSSFMFWLWLGKDILANLFLSFGLRRNNLILIIFIIFILISFLRAFGKKPGPFIIRKPGLPKQHIAWYLFTFFVIMFSIFISSPSTTYTWIKLINYIVSSLIGYIVCYNFISFNPTESILFLITGLIYGFIGYFITGIPTLVIESNFAWRALGVSIGYYNDYYAILWLFALANYFLKKSKSSFLILIASSIISWPMIILLSTRIMPFLLIVCSGIIIYLLKNVLSKRHFIANVFMGIFFLSGFLYFIYYFIQANPQNRMAGLLTEGLKTTIVENPRSQQFREAIDDFADNPLLGVGFSHHNRKNIPDPTFIGGVYPHNFFLELMSEMGIFGLIVFTLPIIKVLNIITRWRRRRTFRYHIFPAMLFIYSFLQLQNGYSFFYYPTFWIGLSWVLLYQIFMISTSVTIIEPIADSRPRIPNGQALIAHSLLSPNVLGIPRSSSHPTQYSS